MTAIPESAALPREVRKGTDPRPMSTETPLERTLFRWSGFAMLGITAAFVLWIGQQHGSAMLLKLGGLAAGSFFVAGKLVIFTGLGEGAPSVWYIAFLVFTIDMGCAFVMALWLRPMERLPRVGTWLKDARATATGFLERYPGLKRKAFFGVVAFVLIPVAGAGAITGSFVARLLGLSRLAGVAAIALASSWSTTMFALLAEFVGKRAEDFLKNPVLITFMLVAGAILCWATYRHVMDQLRR
jgi:uncharacterized membrane protein